MAYSLQNFTLNQVLTAAQMNQVEASIKDHVHGRDGVGGSGISWNYSAQSDGFSVTADDSGKHFLVSPIPYSSGTLVVDLANISSLGSGWAATFTNVGSRGCVLIDPASTEKINAQSEFCLGLGETVVVHTDGTTLRTYGQQGMKLIHTEVGSSGPAPGYATSTISYNVAWDSFEMLEVHYGYESADTLLTGYTTQFGSAIVSKATTGNSGIAGDWVHARLRITQTNVSSIWGGFAIGHAMVGSELVQIGQAVSWTGPVAVGTATAAKAGINFYCRIYGENKGNVMGMNDGPALTL